LTRSEQWPGVTGEAGFDAGECGAVHGRILAVALDVAAAGTSEPHTDEGQQVTKLIRKGG
jgi:hypothetical protein